MQLTQRLRRLMYRARRGLSGAGVDHEPIVEIVGVAPARPRRRARPPARLFGASVRAAAGFLAAILIAGALYGWLAAEDARAPTAIARAVPSSAQSDGVSACLALLDQATAPSADPMLVWSAKAQRSEDARMGAVRAVGRAAGAYAGLLGAAQASAIAPAAALADAETLDLPTIKLAAEALSRAVVAEVEARARLAALSHEASADLSARAAALRAAPVGFATMSHDQERRIVAARGAAEAWSIILSAETAAVSASFGSALTALDHVRTFAPAFFLAPPGPDHAGLFAARLDEASIALARVADETAPSPLRGLAR